MTGESRRRVQATHLNSRRLARTRSGSPCQAPAMKNGRSRIHGGLSPGAPKGSANGACRHGLFTAEAIAARREIAALDRAMRETAEDVS
ncbi:HGGxSTG domain-containing protein [Methylocella sp.]|uniref:HGGxSTG domain-containing protein n=1 Tax=Methylocella sp. TaxID=1978226 RepID=UPI0035B313F4